MPSLKIKKQKRKTVKSFLILITLVSTLLASDIIIKQSECSVDSTIKNIENIVRKKGLGVFAIINHKGNAESVGMKLRESKEIIFGNPKIGTALMQQDMTVGLDLPIRILVYKDKDGSVKIAYRNGEWLREHHIIDAPKKIEKINKALEKITIKAGQCKRD